MSFHTVSRRFMPVIAAVRREVPGAEFVIIQQPDGQQLFQFKKEADQGRRADDVGGQNILAACVRGMPNVARTCTTADAIVETITIGEGENKSLIIYLPNWVSDARLEDAALAMARNFLRPEPPIVFNLVQCYRNPNPSYMD